jgi:hypothetical protein
MNSTEARQITTTFLNQLRGVFPGLEKLPSILEEIEQRETAVAAKDARSVALDNTLLEKEWCIGELDQKIAARQAELASVEAAVREKMATEERRLRAEIEAKLAPAHAEHAAVTKQLDDKLAVLAALRT